MKSFEDNTHAFVIRVWLEPREIEDAQPEWRGVIEHIPTGERRYLRNLNDLTSFITSYLERMGVKVSVLRHASDWVKVLRAYILRRL